VRRANKKRDIDLHSAPDLGLRLIFGSSGNLGNYAMNMDITEHRKTYALFMSLTKWGIVSLIALMVLMAIFLL